MKRRIRLHTVVCLVMVMLCGCSSNHSSSSLAPETEAAWASDMRNAIATLEEAYRQYQLIYHESGYSQRDPEDAKNEDEVVQWALAIPVETSVDLSIAAIHVSEAIPPLWQISGQCAFADIPRFSVVERCPEILTRYRIILAEQRLTPREDLWRGHLRHNVDMLATDYFWWAYDVLQAHIYFGACPITLRTGDMPVPYYRRLEIRNAMNMWLNANETSLHWYARGTQFTTDADKCPFQQPMEFLEVFPSSSASDTKDQGDTTLEPSVFSDSWPVSTTTIGFLFRLILCVL